MKNRKKYLLDTNICIELLRGSNRNVALKMIEKGCGNCFLSEITVFELMFGVYNSHKVDSELKKVKEFISHYEVLSLVSAAECYGKTKVQLRKNGAMIDEFDLLIGCTALANGMVMVTDNERHFDRIEGMEIENWIIR